MNSTATRTQVQTSRPVWLGKPSEDGRWDHTAISNQVMDDQRLGRLEMAVYQGITRHANPKTGESWPSTETIARYARCSRNSVFKALKRLVELGYLVMKSGQGRGVNHYWVKLPDPVEKQEPATQRKRPLSRNPAKLSRDADTRRKPLEGSTYPYIPASGDTHDDSQPTQSKKHRLLSDARRSEMRQVDCPKCGAVAGESCIGSRQRFSLRKYFHAERGDVAALWATEHLTLSSVTKDICWTCQDAGRTIDVNNTVRPCADCRGGPS